MRRPRSTFQFRWKVNVPRSFFALSRFWTENQFPPRIKSGAGIFLKMRYRRRITAASSHAIARYISDETSARMVIPVITMFILKIWLPYWMR
jgi:hypothetical protein